MEQILIKFVNEIKSVCEKKLYSIILYGSKASGEAVENRSDYNILIIIDDLKFSDLKSMSFVIKKWVRNKNPVPTIFSTERFKKSIDVFPIEFLDMKQNHKVLYGKDIFDEVIISDENLRHQCEYELKSNLLKLRQMYIMSRGSAKELFSIVMNSLTSFLVVFKSIIYLDEKIFPIKKIDALNLLSKRVNFDTEPFLTALQLKTNNKEMSKINAEELLNKYVTEIEKIIDFVDNIKVN